jgi:hypothetical protein
VEARLEMGIRKSIGGGDKEKLNLYKFFLLKILAHRGL